MVRKAVKSLLPGKSTDGVVIVVGTGRVPNTLQSGPDTEWTLGGYLMEIGGLSPKNRTIFGFYRPDSEDEDEVYIGCTHSIKLNLFDDLFFPSRKAMNIGLAHQLQVMRASYMQRRLIRSNFKVCRFCI